MTFRNEGFTVALGLGLLALLSYKYSTYNIDPGLTNAQKPTSDLQLKNQTKP